AAKLGKEREQLLAVHERALLLRTLTLQSAAVGVSGRLLSVDYKDATLRANVPEPKPRRLVLPERVKHLGPASEKLGFWFSNLGTAQVANLLRVEF
ncbi:three component ABC system middle component, partial [Mesorhizobium sp. M7A.F.Ca.MR.148.00.0.0]